MPVGRRAVLLSAVVMLSAVLAASADAQISLPRRPSIPRPAPAAAAPPAHQPSGANITPNKLDALIRGLEAMAAVKAEEDQNRKQRKAEQDAREKAKGEQIVAAMLAQSDCEDKAKEKDPRYKQLEHVNNQANAAADRGDDKAAERLNQQASELVDQLDAVARAACGGACADNKVKSDPRNRQLAELKAQAARESNEILKSTKTTEATLLEIQIRQEAERDCGPMKAAASTPEDEAAKEAARQADQRAKEREMKAAHDASQMTAEEFARVLECVIGRLAHNTTPPLTEESANAIDDKREELSAAVRRAGL